MAFPQVASVTASSQSPNSTTSTVTLPGTFSAGDLFIGIVAADSGAGAMTWPAGWTEILDSAGTGFQLSIGYRIAQAGDTAPGVTHTTERSNHLLIRITGWHGTTAPEITTMATGSSVNPNSGSLTPSWGVADTLWISVAASDDSVAHTYTGFPYASNNNENGTATSAARVAMATTESAAASVDPGNFTISASETWGAVTIGVRPAAGSSLSRTATDSLTHSESLTRTVTLARSASDAWTSSDTATRVATLLRAIADALTHSDTAAASKILPRSASDSRTSSDTATRTLTLARSVADALTHSDTVARALTLARSVADSLTHSDTATRIVTLPRSAADALTHSDTATRIVTLARSAADSLTHSDAATRTLTLARSVADALTHADVVVRALTLVRAISDAWTSSDTASAVVTPGGTTVTRTAADSLTFTDAAVRAVVLARIAVDSLTHSDVAARTATLFRSLADALTHSDSAVASTVMAFITGVTRTAAGAILGLCTVHAFRTADDVEVGQTVSALDGTYSIAVAPGVAHYLVAYKVGSPDRAGTTVNTIVGT